MPPVKIINLYFGLGVVGVVVGGVVGVGEGRRWAKLLGWGSAPVAV